MQEEGKGMVFWHPKGLTLWRTIENYVRRRLDEADYIEVRTPQVLDRKFWEQSGHWEKYRDNMFIAETAEDETLSLKPMNCPGHVQIFKQGQKSYRDLPMRMAESALRRIRAGRRDGSTGARGWRDPAPLGAVEGRRPASPRRCYGSWQRAARRRGGRVRGRATGGKTGCAELAGDLSYLRRVG
jgi:hypothetical protein